jgi:hypothetical protein
MTKSELKAMKRTLEDSFLYEQLHKVCASHRDFRYKAIELLSEEIYKRRVEQE